MKGVPTKTWSVYERRRLLKLGALDQPWNVVARAFPGRSADACKVQFNIMRRKARGLPVAADKPRAIIGPRVRHTADDVRFSAAPRQPEPDYADLTSAFFGDPRPGRSALDQKRAAMEGGAS